MYIQKYKYDINKNKKNLKLKYNFTHIISYSNIIWSNHLLLLFIRLKIYHLSLIYCED